MVDSVRSAQLGSSSENNNKYVEEFRQIADTRRSDVVEKVNGRSS